jgi:uncharacterized protein with FMN-binding domain
MPKRGAIALALTTVALILLFSFKTPDTGMLAAGGNLAIVQPGGGTPPPAAAAPAATSAPAAAGPTTAPQPAKGQAASTPASDTRTTPRATAAQPAPTATPKPSSGGAALASGTVTGPVVQTQFGPVQVQVTLANGKITNVTALQLPSDRQRSAYISSIVGPMLQSETLAAQSAQIDLISGATYTSDAYAQSLQAALDQAAHG